MSTGQIEASFSLGSPAEARAFYDDWAETYEAEMSANEYSAPLRCARALAEHAVQPWAPVADFGCGTGLGGEALADAGFSCIDGFDVSPEMLARAGEKSVYRRLDCAPLDHPPEDIGQEDYQNAAAIGALHPGTVPTTALDAVLALLPASGCFVFSLDDKAARDGWFKSRILELCEYHVAEPVFRERGRHLPGIGLESTVYVLKKR